MKLFDSFLSLHSLVIAMEKKTSNLAELRDESLQKWVPIISVLKTFGFVLPLDDDRKACAKCDHKCHVYIKLSSCLVIVRTHYQYLYYYLCFYQ
jgi:hypothetical protein